MPSKRYAEPDKTRCVACGACTQECPRQAASVWKGCYAQIDAVRCVGCGRCAAVCPVGCIALKPREEVHA